MYINEGKDKLALFSTKYNVLLTPPPFQFYLSPQSLLHNFIIFPPQCFYSLLHNFYYFPSSTFFIPLLLLFIFIVFPAPPPPPHFLRLRRETECLVLRFMEDVNMQRRNLISLSELGHGPLKFSFRRVRLHVTK